MNRKFDLFSYMKWGKMLEKGVIKMKPAIYAQKDIISIVLELLRKYNAESAILFGSYARQDATEESDIDLLVIGGPCFDLTDIFALADDLHRATGKEVDVYEKCEVYPDSALHQSILREGVRIA